METTLDKQVLSQRCPECDVEFVIVRGSVYDGGEAFGLYLIALHGHSPEGRLAHLAIAVRDLTSAELLPVAAAIVVIVQPEESGFSLVEWEESPWRGEGYLGLLLTPDQVRASPHRDTFFHIAEHVVRELPEVQVYLA